MAEFQEKRAVERDFLKQAQANAGGESSAKANDDAKDGDNAGGGGGIEGGGGSSLSKEGVLNILTAEGVPSAGGEGQADAQAGVDGKAEKGGGEGKPRASWSKTGLGKKK